MEDKYMFCVKCDNLEELNVYTNAVDNKYKLEEIYNLVRSYDKHLDYSEENYDKLIDGIKELSYE
jgi:hypothetical protein